jgi:hypothetical protein
MIAVTVSRTRKTGPSSVIARMARRVEAALFVAGEVLLEDSKQLVPRDTQTLATDGHVRKIGSGLRTTVIVGYGTKGVVWAGRSPHESAAAGRDVFVIRIPYNYAVWVHINPKNHNYVTGQAEFLSIPHRTSRPRMILEMNMILRGP